MAAHAALENLTVLDLTRVLAGPFCTMMLADMGARVIKIEIPNGGDDTRAYPPFRANTEGEQESIYFANINRNKKGITLNLKSEEGKKLFRDLVKKADIVVENYRPGVMAMCVRAKRQRAFRGSLIRSSPAWMPGPIIWYLCASREMRITMRCVPKGCGSPQSRA